MLLLDTGTLGTSREIYSEDADDDSNSQPLGYKPSALDIELNSSKAIAGKELSLSSSSSCFPKCTMNAIFLSLSKENFNRLALWYLSCTISRPKFEKE